MLVRFIVEDRNDLEVFKEILGDHDGNLNGSRLVLAFWVIRDPVVH